MIDKSAFRTLSYGLYIVTSRDSEGKKYGCVANTFQQVASNPPMASVALHKDNATTKAILESGKYAVSVLGESATMELIGRFGFRSSHEIDKFAETEHRICEEDLPRVISACVATFSVRVQDEVDAGSHYMFVGPVTSAEMISEAQTDEKPMTYSYYHEVLRGKTPPKAVSYTDEVKTEVLTEDGGTGTETAKVPESVEAEKPRYGWRCKLCGYIEMMDELPDDYVCPICGVGKDMFERVEI